VGILALKCDVITDAKGEASTKHQLLIKQNITKLGHSWYIIF